MVSEKRKYKNEQMIFLICRSILQMPYLTGVLPVSHKAKIY
jgi:hypothetical protein